MKFGITRWNTVPEYSGSELLAPVRSVHSLDPVARPTKLATVAGACSGYSSTVKLPSR
jgi:hypothetical protein